MRKEEEEMSLIVLMYKLTRHEKQYCVCSPESASRYSSGVCVHVCRGETVCMRLCVRVSHCTVVKQQRNSLMSQSQQMQRAIRVKHGAEGEHPQVAWGFSFTLYSHKFDKLS